jgi:hypothetical protein
MQRTRKHSFSILSNNGEKPYQKSTGGLTQLQAHCRAGIQLNVLRHQTGADALSSVPQGERRADALTGSPNLGPDDKRRPVCPGLTPILPPTPVNVGERW